MARKITVYRFIRTAGHQRLSPKYMAGTLEAIADLGAQPIMDSARTVEAKLLEEGFFYEHTPSTVQAIE